jgi:flagellar basal body rod protein FlgG
VIPVPKKQPRAGNCSSKAKPGQRIFRDLRSSSAARKCPPRRIRQDLGAGCETPILLFGEIRSLLKKIYPTCRLALVVLFSSRMDPMTAIAASGLRARMESLDLLANNIANASTGGYKADREFYSLYVAPEASGNDAASTMPLIERPWVDHAQGVLHNTGNPLDVALTGKGFFAVNGPSGPLYTRNGNFHLAADGKLTSPDGYPVRDAQGAALTLQSTRALDISSDGTITQDGVIAGKLEIVDFTSTAGLTKQGSNYFRINDPSVRPAAVSGTSVEQGHLEASNTGGAEGAVRLVSVMRQFEMLQKAVSLGAEMNRKAIDEVAKV